MCFNDSVGKNNGVLNIIGECGSKSLNAMKRIHRKGPKDRSTNSKHYKSSKKNYKGSAKKITRVQVIQNMVLGSIKRESVSLFTIIFSDVKL